MSIKFKLSRWDIFYSSFVMSFGQPYLIIVLIFLFLLLVIRGWTGTSESDLITRVLIVVIYCIPPLVFFLTILGLYFLFVILSKNNETLLSEQNWIINNELITYETDISRSELKWKGVKKISVHGSYCFLYFSQMGACIIPKRAFGSDQEWKEFINLCRSKLTS